MSNREAGTAAAKWSREKVMGVRSDARSDDRPGELEPVRNLELIILKV